MQKKIDFLLKVGMLLFSIVVIFVFISEMKTDTIAINGVVSPLSKTDNILIAILFALVFLLIIFLTPPFGFVTYYLIYRSVTKNKIRKNAKFERQNLEYCREHLNFLAPSLLSYLDNFYIEYEKDIAAHILKLVHEKIIIVDNNQLIVTDNNTSLSESDCYILNLVKNKKLGSKTEYERLIEKEAKEQGLLKNKDDMIKKLVITIIVGFAVVPVIYNLFFFQLFFNISNLSVSGIILIVIMMFLPIIWIVLIFVQVFTTFKEKTNMIRTKKGNQILKNALGLKLFLKDFSTLSDSSWKEVYTRDYYLIYAVVFGINKKIPKELLEMLEH